MSEVHRSCPHQPIGLCGRCAQLALLPEPEHIIGSPEFGADLQTALEEKPSPQAVLMPGADVAPTPRRPRLAYTPHQVLAIAAALVASSPGMFGGPDILPPIDVDRYRDTLKKASSSGRPPIVIDSVRSPDPEQPPVVERNRYRNPPGSGKPAGSKLARKAARGKL